MTNTYTWFNFETLFRSLKDELKDFLIDNEIYFEISATGAFCGWHFEIKATEKQAAIINEFLDKATICHKAL